MRGIGQEALVARIAFVQPGQRAVDRPHQRGGFFRHVAQGQSRLATIDVDATGLLGRRAQSAQRAPHHQMVANSVAASVINAIGNTIFHRTRPARSAHCAP